MRLSHTSRNGRVADPNEIHGVFSPLLLASARIGRSAIVVITSAMTEKGPGSTNGGHRKGQGMPHWSGSSVWEIQIQKWKNLSLVVRNVPYAITIK
jgi:hypothetical protein